MSILVLLLVLLLSMVNGATKLWKSNENRVDSYREARAAINLIASDLSSIYPSFKLTYFYTQDDKLPATPVKVTGMDGSLFFLTSIPTTAQGSGNKSDLCTVGYYLGFDKTSLTGKGTESYNLYRYFRGSDDTFKELTNSDDIIGNVEIQTSPITVSSEVLAKNITGFEVAAFTIPSPSKPGDAYGTPVKFVKDAKTPLPDLLEIKIKAINNEAAKRFTNASGGADKAAWENPGSRTRQQEEREFTTRIYLKSGAQVKAATATSPAGIFAPTPTPSPSPSPTPAV